MRDQKNRCTSEPIHSFTAAVMTLLAPRSGGGSDVRNIGGGVGSAVCRDHWQRSMRDAPGQRDSLASTGPEVRARRRVAEALEELHVMLVTDASGSIWRIQTMTMKFMRATLLG